MRERRRRSLGRVAALLAATPVVLVLLAAGAPPAAAHTDVVASTPRDGDTVTLATDRLVLVFGEDVDPASAGVVVTDPTGADVVTGAPRVESDTLEVPLRLRVAGPHVVGYRVTGPDGHPVVGELRFDAGRGGADVGVAASLAGAPGGVPPSATPSQGAGPRAWPLVVVAALGAALLIRRASRRPAPVTARGVTHR